MSPLYLIPLLPIVVIVIFFIAVYCVPWLERTIGRIVGNACRAMKVKRAFAKHGIKATFNNVNIQAKKSNITITPEGIFRDGVLVRESDEVIAEKTAEQLKTNTLGE